jgi:hypothetical protein
MFASGLSTQHSSCAVHECYLNNNYRPYILNSRTPRILVPGNL